MWTGVKHLTSLFLLTFPGLTPIPNTQSHCHAQQVQRKECLS